MPFAALGLAPELVRAVADEGYEQPTPIQSEAIPLALAGRDLIGSAQTGTGKTAAFVLPILQRLSSGPRGVLRALILVPTRELAEQVAASIRAYGRHTHVKGAAVYGGVGMEPQTHALRQGVDMIVATPGRLLDHMERGHADFSRLQVLVLDEADRMLDMGFAPDVKRILNALPDERQTMLFSATISPEVDALARRALNGHASVEIGRRAQAAEGIEHVIVACDKLQKRGALGAILKAKPAGQTLIFTRTKYGRGQAGHVPEARRDRGERPARRQGAEPSHAHAQPVPRGQRRDPGGDRHRRARDRRRRDPDGRELRRADRSRGLRAPGRPHGARRRARARAHADLAR
jgi:ATP-dependent RNA helicase RhlE